MDKEIYLSVMEALLSLQDEDGEALVKYVDLWNRNVEFIDQEAVWERPAVFVEFLPLVWEHSRAPQGKTWSMRSQGAMRLHIVTDWHGSASSDEAAKVVRESLGRVDLGEAIERALTGLYGERFNRMHLVESAYSHDHEEIVEDVQSYRYVTWKEW